MTDTKSRILDKALELFNERGTANVTTNHIAEALGMSPGNLYYHYRNKAEIVRGLFARIIAAWSEASPGTRSRSWRRRLRRRRNRRRAHHGQLRTDPCDPRGRPRSGLRAL